MSATTKILGLLTGASAVAVISVAFAQGVEPHDYIKNPALGAGQQSTYHTGMGETGLPPVNEAARVAVIIQEPVVAVAPAPVETVAVAPAPVETTTMGAGPAPAPVEAAPAPKRVRADRN
ncbi:MAG: hypothetical protein HYX47_22770 [Burkholderiales bacterium]|nr:hypothetical protein [Burkholderiales bacterium]